MPEPRAGLELPGTGEGDRAKLNSEKGTGLSSAALMETHHCWTKTSAAYEGPPCCCLTPCRESGVRFGMDSTVL